MSGYMREIKEPYFNVNGTDPAMTKVTIEQAIELLRQHDTLVQDKGREFYISIDNEQAESIADLLESLSTTAGAKNAEAYLGGEWWKMTKEELQAIRERCDRATNDEWIVQDSEHNSSFKVEIKNPGKGAYNICHIAIGASYKKHDERFVRCKNNAEFIANARQDIPALLDYIEKLEAVAGAARELIPYHDDNIDDLPTFYQHEVGMYISNKLKQSIAALDGEEVG